MKKIIPFIFISIIFTTSFATAQDAARIQQSIDKAVAYLRTTQTELGSWHTPRTSVGPTAVVMAGLLAAGVDIDDPMIVRGLRFVAAITSEDGGIYTPEGFLMNYETAVAMMMFARANDAHYKKHGTKPYDELLAKAEVFLRGQQFTSERGFAPDHPWYGGAGYSRGTRPDMGNMAFFLDALKAVGAQPDDPAIQSALVFVSRSQNLESPHNNMPFLTWNAADNPEFLDGGFIYYASPDPDGTREVEGLQSYGGMTYNGLRSMIYAGLTPDDIRVQAALSWMSRNYSVTENPGRGAAGLFYYYMMMARTLDVMQFALFEDSDGEKHNWRHDLSEHLISVQRADGSWLNVLSSQYMENDANLVTGYVLLVMALCMQQ